MGKIPVYFMPGLAASSLIFERISLPDDIFETVLLDWELPFDDEPLLAYTKRMVKHIKHENPVLIGVSFGGILVQEMARLIPVRKVIIISSIKSNREMPTMMKFAKLTRAYKLLPTDMFLDLDKLARFTFVKRVKERLPLYKKYMTVRDKKYLDWAVARVLFWDRIKPDENVVHIQGDHDEIFPIKYIKGCVVVKSGTHVMILTRYKWFNENLPKLILGSL